MISPVLVVVATLFANCVELIEEKDARLGPHIIEQLTQARIGLAKIASDQRIVADDEEREAKAFGDGLGKGSLAVAWRPRQKHAMAWLKSTGTQDVGSLMFLEQLAGALSRAGKGNRRSSSDKRASTSRIASLPFAELRCGELAVSAGGVTGTAEKSPLETVGNDIMLFGALVSCQCLGGRAQHVTVTGCAGANERNQKIATCHDRCDLLPGSRA